MNIAFRLRPEGSMCCVVTWQEVIDVASGSVGQWRIGLIHAAKETSAATLLSLAALCHTIHLAQRKSHHGHRGSPHPTEPLSCRRASLDPSDATG